MKGADIVNNIIDHRELYENAGKKVLAYRLTCQEHKAISDWLSKDEKNKFKGIIKEFFGVQIELVTHVEDIY